MQNYRSETVTFVLIFFSASTPECRDKILNWSNKVSSVYIVPLFKSVAGFLFFNLTQWLWKLELGHSSYLLLSTKKSSIKSNKRKTEEIWTKFCYDLWPFKQKTKASPEVMLSYLRKLISLWYRQQTKKNTSKDLII